MKVILKKLFLFILIFVWAGCARSDEEWSQMRERMIQDQMVARGIKDPNVLEALRKVKRHLFVPEDYQEESYEDRPLPIGHEQTISQPYIVAYMTEAAGLKPTDKILEIGTGSGYQAAVLAEIVKEVYTIEIVKPLAEQVKERLQRLGYKNIFVKHGDGYKGWPEHAPYDVIIVTAAPENIPEKLIEQLSVGGRMIIPIGSIYQELYRITKTKDGVKQESLLPVRFVPMVEEKHEQR